MRISPFQAMFPNLDVISSNDAFFGTVKETFPKYRDTEFFTSGTQPSIFIYQIEQADRTFTGIIACADLEDYLNGKIKKHENTLSRKETYQQQLLKERKANIKPVLLTYHPVAAINKFITDFLKKKKPIHSFQFKLEVTTHYFFEIKKADQIEKLQKLFIQNVAQTYIADGHHRCSASALFYESMKKKKKGADYQNLLCAYFPTDELQIFDFNRIVKTLRSSTEVMSELSEVFEVKKLKTKRKPKQKHELTIFTDNQWYALKWKKEILNTYKSQKVVLDARLLDKHVLKPIFGIKNVKTNTRIKYVEGVKPIQKIIDKVNKEEGLAAFFIYPVKMEELLFVADQDKVMPPKSTWFEPRMKNGLIAQEFIKM